MLNVGKSTKAEQIISFFLGHDRASKISEISTKTEAAILVIIMEFGIFVFLPYLALMLFPIYLYYSKPRYSRVYSPLLRLMHFVQELLLYFITVLFFDQQVFFLFFCFYSMFLKSNK